MSCTKTDVGMRPPVAAVEAMTSGSLAAPASFQPPGAEAVLPGEPVETAHPL